MWKWLIVLCVAAAANINAEIRVLAFAGSTREGSFNKKLVAEAADFARQVGAKVTFIDLRDYSMPFYDGDLESGQGMPEKAKQLRKLIQQNQVILVASPEYNSSLSAVLKNTIDWISRDEKGGPSRDVLKGKKVVIMSASPGSNGGNRGLVHLRAILEDVGAAVVSQQFVLPNAFNAFSVQGHLMNLKLKQELQQLIQSTVR